MSSIVIYEVNLDIKRDAYEKNKEWLIEHIKDMVNHNHFIKVNILHQLNLDPTNDSHHRFHRITAQYFVPSYEDLENYLAKQAKNMRNQVLEVFKDNYSVFRRVFSYEQEIKRQVN
jgi:hypothetical protein